MAAPLTPLDAALSYLAQGWHVFPIHRGSKAPLTPQGHHNATTNEDQVREWWSIWPDANVGIALNPSGLYVLDIDCKKGAKGYESLAELEADGPFPRAATVNTPTGGMHIYFRRPEGLPACRVIGFKPGLDLLGDGYVLAPPSILDGLDRPYD